MGQRGGQSDLRCASMCAGFGGDAPPSNGMPRPVVRGELRSGARRLRTTTFLLLALCAALSNARAQTIVEYPIPTPLSKPTGITAGPDGNVWFTEMGCSMIGGVCLSKIGKITPSGAMTEYTIPTPESYPAGIALGPDSNLWFCEQQGSSIGRITPSGIITEYPVPTSGSQPYGITAGPDGNLWFTEWLSGKVGKITPEGVITEYATNSYGFSYAITAGPDGRLWSGSSVVGQMSATVTDGVVSNINLTYNAGVLGIATGPDGKIWYTSTGGQLARSDPNSPGVVQVYNLKRSQGGRLGMIAPGPDNDLWFTVEYGENGIPLIGRITTAGVVSEYALSNTLASPFGIATGPDGDIWFTDYGGNAIGMMPVARPHPRPFPLRQPRAVAIQ